MRMGMGMGIGTHGTGTIWKEHPGHAGGISPARLLSPRGLVLTSDTQHVTAPSPRLPLPSQRSPSSLPEQFSGLV